MKHIVRKAYINYEKEENWLNEMSAKGLALVDYSWCRYVFEECEPSTYIYRLEMLKSVPSTAENQKYIEFLEQTGIEHVASYMRWIFLRKKSETGSFDIFTDLASRIQHHKRIALFLLPLSILNLGIGVINLINGLTISSHQIGGISLLNLTLGIIIGTHVLRHFKKVISLKQDKKIYES